MAESDVEAFLAATDAMNRGDFEAFVEFAHPDCVFEPRRTATEGVYEGRDGVRKFAADTAETFDVFHAEYPEIRDLGDRILAIGTIRVRGRGSGLETHIASAAVAEYRDGLVWRWKDYGDADAALAATGR